jgi:hypothetical protein
MTFQELKELARHSLKRTAPTNYTVETVDKAVLAGFQERCKSINDFMRNRYDIYEIIMENADEFVPNKVIDALGMFAEVQQVPQGQKSMFKRRLGKNRAKQFITQVGLSGVYETFRLDSDTYSVTASARGGAVSIDFERMLDDVEILSECMEIITEGLVDSAYMEVHKALRAAITNIDMPEANKVTLGEFDADAMVKLISIVKAYGPNAVIFATPEFVAAMGADCIAPPPASGLPGVYHPQDIDAIHNQGYINIFRGTPIVQLPQSFVDDQNVKTQLDPQYAYILPAGKEKVVKFVLEGNTQMYDFQNRDQSMEIHVYKKMGCGIAAYNNWCVYRNTGIASNFEDMYGIDTAVYSN